MKETVQKQLMKKIIQMLVLIVVVVVISGCSCTRTTHADGSRSFKWNGLLDGANVTVYKVTTPAYHYMPPVVIIDRSHYQSYGVWGGAYIQNGYGHRGYGRH